MKNIKKGLFLLSLAVISCKSKIYENNLAENLQPILVSDKFSFTEGPSSDKYGNVYFTDQPNDKIYFWNWKTNTVEEFLNKTGRANGTFFDKDDNLITCSDEKGEIWKISKSGTSEILVKNFDHKRLNGPNDLWIDNKNGIYFTDPLYERDYWAGFKQEIPEKNLYYRDHNGTIIKLDTFVQPNGIIGSEILKKLYVSDIDANKTYVYDIVGNGKLTNKRIFCNLGSDGMTLDNLGNLYITGNGVTVFNKKGEQISHILVPEKWTANVTFGGEKFSTLFITASKSVYTLKMNVSRIK